MSLSIGIVGLPNVGKSTLFQTLTKKQVDIANYPFCTIEPNVGVVAVADERADKLAELSHSAKKIYATVKFVDIAGLIKGASQGEGLGNKFLAHIRETDAIIYVLRAFSNNKIINTQEEVNPLKEKEILDVELILKDLETVNKRLEHLAPEIKSGKKENLMEYQTLLKTKEILIQEKILSEIDWPEEEKKVLKNLQLLTMKPRLYLLNGKDEEVPPYILEIFQKNNWPYLIIDLLTELETVDFSSEERVALGLSKENELDILIKESYHLLNLITFLTTRLNETRAWTIKNGSKITEAAGIIHSDFEKYFIRAEVIPYNDLMKIGSFNRARELGLLRVEGREYVVKDGDVIEIKHNAPAI